MRRGPATPVTPGAPPAGPAPPRGLPGRVRRDWAALAAPATAGADGAARLDPARLGGLPAPVRRWLGRAIAPGTPLARSAVLGMRGRILLGRWRPFAARQVLAPGAGYIWAAAAGRRPAIVRGYDRLVGEAAEMRWRLLGLVPVMTASGPDLARSAAGRLAGEMVLCPSSALAPGVRWSGVDDRRAVAEVRHGPWTDRVTLEVDDAGRPVAATLPRWGRPTGGAYAEHPFGARFEGDLVAGGHTIPARVTAGWWPGEERWASGGEFFRAVIERARFL